MAATHAGECWPAAGFELRVVGTPPSAACWFHNHLSYLDIAATAAAMPCAFVSKIEVSRWPFFGVDGAQSGGTIFIDRSSRASAEDVALEIAGSACPCRVPILVFPEGTSTDGTGVLRFHSGLFEPAAAAGAPITAAAVSMQQRTALPNRIYAGSATSTFLPNLWKVLGATELRAHVTFGQPLTYPDRRTAASATQAEVEAMRAAYTVNRKTAEAPPQEVASSGPSRLG